MSKPGEVLEIQKTCIEDLYKTLNDRLDDLQSLDTPKGHVTVFEESNTFAILGSRGAGKSTILRAFHNAYYNNNDSPFEILPPIDCTTVTSEMSPGTVVFSLIHDYLSQRSENGADLEKLEDIAGHYLATSPESRELSMELSNSVKEFTNHQVRMHRERIRFQREIDRLLGQLLPRNSKRRAFVVLLDDFDLVPDGPEIRRWLQAMLDELRQTHLLMVLTADFYRLQNLSLGLEQQYDDKTGRALIYKLLPSANRLILSDWGPTEYVNFSQMFSPSLLDLMDEVPHYIGRHNMLLKRLLPKHPRGLRDFWVTLKRSAEKYRGMEQSLAGGELARSILRAMGSYLEILATSRQESLLARELLERRPLSWVRELSFSEKNCNTEFWDEMVVAARQRAFSESDNQHFPILSPLSRLVPRIPQKDKNINEPVNYTADVTTLRNSSNKDSIPLRDEVRERHPLKDGFSSEVTFWSELLLNIGFAKVEGLDNITTMRNRIHFIENWKPIHERFELTTITQEFGSTDFQLYLEDEYYTPLNPCYYWIKIDSRDANSAVRNIHIGWRCLIEILRGNDANSLSETSSFTGNIPFMETRSSRSIAPDPHPLDVLPDEVWAMILLVDGLERCPWSTFSLPRVWHPITYVGLAAALVRSAYVYALHACTILRDQDLRDTQRAFIGVLKKRNPEYLLFKPKYEDDDAFSVKLGEDDIIEILHLLFEEELNWDSDDSLSCAAKSFLSSDAYTQARIQISKRYKNQKRYESRRSNE